MGLIESIKKNYGINLNEQQKKAVTHLHGPALVLAGPGSGKTTVITARTAYLIYEAGIKPESILTMTFNRAAKHEMETRYKRVFGKDESSRVHFSTLHSFCNLVVRDYEKRQGKRLKRIEGNEEAEEGKHRIVKNIYQQVNGSIINDDELENLVNEIGLVKNRMLKDLEIYNSNTKNFAQVYKAYEEYKKRSLLMDFDDMLTFALSILIRCGDILNHYRSKYRFIQVDEGQDLSKIQFEILKLLVGNNGENLFIVADDDQSIYGFRGAEPQYILDIEKQLSGCRIYRLENNYRSTRNIVEISSGLIKFNKNRYDKNHFTGNDYNFDPYIVHVKDEGEQLAFIINTVRRVKREAPGDMIAILYRNNLSSILVVDGLERAGIRFGIKQNRLFFFNHWLVLDILAFLKFALDQTDLESFSRICFKMKRFISKSMMEHVFKSEVKESVIDVVMESGEVKPFQAGQILSLKNEFKHLSRLHPEKALRYIEDNLNYFDSVREYCELTGLTYDYLYSLFGILKALARCCPTILLFLERIDTLGEFFGAPAAYVQKPEVFLSTIHSAKGLEYDHVLMVDLVNSEFPGNKALEQAKKDEELMLEEERRLFYVGMTRAKEHLYLISPEKRRDGLEARSVFVKEVIACMNKKTLNEIGEGMLIQHKHFGVGVVTAVLEQNHGHTVLELDFKGIRRKLDYDTCMENGLLSF